MDLSWIVCNFKKYVAILVTGLNFNISWLGFLCSLWPKLRDILCKHCDKYKQIEIMGLNYSFRVLHRRTYICWSLEAHGYCNTCKISLDISIFFLNNYYPF